MCAAPTYVRFTPDSDRESGPPLNAMSALPPKADMCGAMVHVCFGPKADIVIQSLHQLQPLELGGIVRPSLLAVLKLTTKSNCVGCRTDQGDVTNWPEYRFSMLSDAELGKCIEGG